MPILRTVHTRIQASAPQVKSSLAPDGQGGMAARWDGDEKIAVFAGSVSGTPSVLENISEPGKTAVFEGDIKSPTGKNTLYALGPNSAFSAVTNDGIVKVRLSHTQCPVKDSFDPESDILVAAPYEALVPEDGDLSIDDMRFARIMAVVQVIVKDETEKKILTGERIDSIRMTSSTETLSGNALIKLSDASIVGWADGYKYIEADLTGDSLTVDDKEAAFLVSAPAVLPSGSKLTFDVRTENYTLRKEVTLETDLVLKEASSKINTINLSLADEHIVKPAKDSHKPGYVFFSDDFNWIAPYYEATKYTKYGWVSEKLDGTNYNEYALSADSSTAGAFTERGYEFDAANTYVKYEGWVRLGKSGSTGMLKLPALEGIDANTTAEVALTFDTAIYFALPNTPDKNCQIKVFVDGPGEITSVGTEGAAIGKDKKSVVIPIDSDAQHKWVFTRKQLIISGATPETRIRFDDSEAIQARAFLDKVEVTRAAESDQACADELAPLPELEATQSSTGYKDKAPTESTNTPDIRVNRPWTAESAAGWITLNGAQSGSQKYSGPSKGVTVSSDGMEVSVPGTCFPYKLSITTHANSSPSPRSGNVLIKVDGNTIMTISISQQGSGTGDKIESEVYAAATGDHIYYRIPALAQTSDGRILAFCEARTTQTYSDNPKYDFYTGNESMFTVTPDNYAGSGDRGNIDLVMKISNDGGKTWGNMITLVDDNRNTCGNPVPVVDDNGTIHLFFCWQSWPINKGYQSSLVPEMPGTTSATTRRIFYMKSTDNGASWTKPADMTSALKGSAWGWVATGPGHGIQIKDGEHKGRIYIPVNYKPDAGGSTSDTHATCFWSDDYGTTWNVGGSTKEGANESQIVELKGGKLMSSFRHRGGGFRYYAISADGGSNWGTNTSTGIQDAGCQGSTVNYMPDGEPSDNLLISNCNASSRKDLYFGVSYDSGATWTAKKQVITNRASAYSDILICKDGSVCVMYESDSDKFTQTAPYESIRFQAWPESLVKSTFGF